MRFPEITKTVKITEPAKPCEDIKLRSHLYTQFGVSALKTSLNSINLDLVYIRKEGWGLSAGIRSDFDKLYFDAGFLIRLK